MTVADLIRELQKLDPDMQVAAMRCTCDAPAYVFTTPKVQLAEQAFVRGPNPRMQSVPPAPQTFACMTVRFVALVDGNQP